ncbi:hypothetical protein NDK43_09340 [Neobacillus pocheonensis]|uniref:Uncharacterized protein n=1 Tax=Neobacillus pocheonensis TaxID=363869 RepID=A0ABT0WBZ5_9BACI|nr:hypothetical protein [Neobacillus pocheonensis]
MNVSIEIYYIAVEYQNKILRQGSFPLRGKKPEQVSFEWWKQIRKESYVDLELEKIIADGENITQLMKELEKAPLE